MFILTSATPAGIKEEVIAWLTYHARTERTKASMCENEHATKSFDYAATKIDELIAELEATRLLKGGSYIHE